MYNVSERYWDNGRSVRVHFAFLNVYNVINHGPQGTMGWIPGPQEGAMSWTPEEPPRRGALPGTVRARCEHGATVANQREFGRGNLIFRFPIEKENFDFPRCEQKKI